MATYTITREKVTWSRWDPKLLRNRVSHPIVWTVAEDGVDVHTADTKRDAEAWIAAQY